MKPLIKPILALLIAASMAACGKEEAKPALTCESPEVLAQIQEQIQGELAYNLHHTTGLPLDAANTTAEQIQAALSDLGFELADIRTTTPLSDKNQQLGCEATLRLAPKPEAVKRLEQSAESYMELHETDGISAESLLGGKDTALHPDGKGYSRTLAYTARAADNGKPVVETKGADAANDLTFATAFYLAAPDLAKQVAEIRQKSAAEETRQQELNTLDQNRLQARIELLRTQNKQAHDELNKAWQALPAAARTQLKDAQNQWSRLRESQCAYQSKADSTEPLEQEALRIECDTREVQQRIPALKQEAETFTGNQLTEATQRAQAAQQELRNVWQSVPADVKDIIGQDYQSWAASSAAKCAQAAQQAGGGNNGQLARLECTATEARNKAKELRGYVSQ